MKTLADVIKISFFWPLEINQKCTTTQGTFIQDKWLDLNKNCEIFSIFYVHNPLPLIHRSKVALTKQHQNHSSCETQVPGRTKRV